MTGRAAQTRLGEAAFGPGASRAANGTPKNGGRLRQHPSRPMPRGWREAHRFRHEVVAARPAGAAVLWLPWAPSRAGAVPTRAPCARAPPGRAYVVQLTTRSGPIAPAKQQHMKKVDYYVRV
jgi:hypothetical protein